MAARLPAPRPVAGATALPAGFAHPHASEEARRIAEAGLILRVQVGSGVHGTAIDGQDDRDELGLCLEPPPVRDRAGPGPGRYPWRGPVGALRAV